MYYLLAMLTIVVGTILYFEINKPAYLPEDLNQDGVVNFQDFSIAVYLLGNIMDELGADAPCVSTCPDNLPVD